MLPDRVSNPDLLTYESVVLPIALRGPALLVGGVHVRLLYKIETDYNLCKVRYESNIGVVGSGRVGSGDDAG